MKEFWPLFLRAAGLTVSIGAAGILLSFGIGLLCAVILYERIPVLRAIVRCYVALSRNTPLLVQLFFIYYGLPKIGLSISPEACGVSGLAFLGGGYMCESLRSGIDSVSVIQAESAESLGMNRRQTLFYVLLPQALSTSIPSITANVIFLLKETSVFSAVSLLDLMFTAKDLIGLYYKTSETLLMLVISYLMILLPVSLFGRWVERKVRYAEFGT